MTDVVEVPGRWALACVLGGEDRRTLYMATATTTLDNLARLHGPDDDASSDSRVVSSRCGSRDPAPASREAGSRSAVRLADLTTAMAGDDVHVADPCDIHTIGQASSEAHLVPAVVRAHHAVASLTSWVTVGRSRSLAQ